MPIAQGYRSWMGFGKQTVLGTPVARTIFSDFNTETLKEINDPIESARLGSASRRIFEQGLRYTNGSVSIDGNYVGLETLFKNAMGAVVTSTPGGATTARLHTFSLTDELPSPGLSVEINKGGLQAHLYQDMKIASLRLESRANALLQTEWAWIGRQETLVSTSTPSFPALLPILQAHLVLQVDASTVTADSFELSIDEHLSGSDRPNISGRDIKEPVRIDKREVTGVISLDYDSVTNYNKFKNLNDVAVTAVWTGALIESGQNYGFSITLPRVRFRGETPSADGPGVLPLRLSFTALETTRGASDEVSMTMKNTLTSVT